MRGKPKEKGRPLYKATHSGDIARPQPEEQYNVVTQFTT
jgi:hypothetical protein